MVLSESTPVILDSLRFDLALCPDKSIPAGALMNFVRAEEKRGFSIDDSGKIVPLGPEAAELYRMGLDNEFKFFKNTKTAQQLMTEAVGLEHRRDRYVVVLNDQERKWARENRHVAGVEDDEVLVGWNTGCGPRYPYKKHTTADQIRLMVSAWSRIPRKDRTRFALLGGGAEDERRNLEIAGALEESRIPVVRTPCTQGLRRGISAVAACDMVVSGDSLGLHLAIGLKKPVVAWFGVSCHQEVDVYGRGIKVLSSVGCRPCWLSSCPLTPKCFAEMPWDEYADAVAEMAAVLLRDGSWVGERILGDFPPKNRIPQPLGQSPGPVF
jgi:heptosyltransferase-2